MPLLVDKYRSYTAGNFEFILDGERTGAYIKAVEGGFMKSTVVPEQLGSSILPIKHVSVFDIDPISIDFGLSSSESLLKWISDSWEMKWSRRDGQITHGDAYYNESFVHDFKRALIAETSFPTMDGSSKDPGYLKIKLAPEEVETKRVSTTSRLKPGATKSHGAQKLWLSSMFRFSIDGIDEMKYTNKIDAFTIKQHTQPLHTGKFRTPEIEPTKLEFPNISGTISLTRSDGLFKWYEQCIANADEDDNSAQKEATLELLSPDGKTTLLTVNMHGVGMYGLQIPRSEANSDQIKRVKFDLYVQSMTMTMGQSDDWDLFRRP